MMKQELLKRYEKRFMEIVDKKEPIRSDRPTNLMGDMKRVFDIPDIRHPEYLEEHQDVIDLYVKVSLARNIKRGEISEPVYS